MTCLLITDSDADGPHGFPESIKARRADGSVARYSFSGICTQPDDPHDNVTPEWGMKG